MELLSERSRLHHNATHHCWAFRIGIPGSLLERSSDAGEPSGTAGFPILQQMQKIELTNAILVVTRWFGGTKLGKGGLIRAYSRCAAETLNLLRCAINEPKVVLKVECSYNLIGLVENAASRFNGCILGGDYGENAILRVEIPVASEGDFKCRLVDDSGGKITILSE